MLHPSCSGTDDVVSTRSLNNTSTDLQKNHTLSPSPPRPDVCDDADKFNNEQKHSNIQTNKSTDQCLNENSCMGQDTHEGYNRFMNCMELSVEPEQEQQQEQPKISEEEEESSTKAETGAETKKDEEEDCGRERLKKHRMEMAGRVWIPDIWGQESLLKEWMDCSAFDRSLVPNGLVSARKALVEESQRATSSVTTIENRCS